MPDSFVDQPDRRPDPDATDILDEIATAVADEDDFISASEPDAPPPMLVEGEPAIGDFGATADVAASADTPLASLADENAEDADARIEDE